MADERIANLSDATANWIKVSAREDGSFSVTNPRTGATIQISAAPALIHVFIRYGVSASGGPRFSFVRSVRL